MEGLIKVQFALQKNIERSFSNFKKSPKQRINFEFIETKIEILEKDWDKFSYNHTKLNEISDVVELDESVYNVNDVYCTVEESYLEYKTLLKTEKRKLTSSNDIDISQSKPALRLPKISIPLFSGKYSEWTTFRDLFISLVHKNGSLDNVQRMHYLKSHLTGEAEQLIRYIPTTEDNYQQCWNQLENRYNNKKYLANCILKRFFGQKRMFNESAAVLKELLDTTMDCLAALKNLKIDVSTWDLIILHVISFKLDPETRKQWELSVSSDSSGDLPTLKQFQSFIESRFRALEFIETKKITNQFNQSNMHQFNSKVMMARNDTKSYSIRCEYCNDTHKLCFCKKFIDLDCEKRREFVKNKKMCFNCLGGNHMLNQCQKPTSCHTCQRRHHTLLHLTNFDIQRNKGGTSSNMTDAVPVVSCVSTKKFIQSKQVLLATALVKLQSYCGDFQLVRALLDQGSQASFVTEATVQFLRLKKIPIKGVVSGLGESKNIISKYMVTLTLQSLTDINFQVEVNAYVLKTITSYLPEKKVEAVEWPELIHLKLADPEYYKPNKIDLLLGAEVYSHIMKEGIRKVPDQDILAQNTCLGWILSGIVNSGDNKLYTERVTVMHLQFNENDTLRNFWEIEDKLSNNLDKKILTEEEQKCENLFNSTTKRTSEGRYIVKLPFRDDNPQCVGGNTRGIAVRRFKALEKKFIKDPNLKKRYTEVIEEYLLLKHMRSVNQENINEDNAAYLPHHAVIKEERTTTKVRVVFDASCKNEKGVALNDDLLVGPSLQLELRHIIMRWRVHPIAIIADITKMYRQILVADEDVHFQRIVWRDNPNEEIRDFELLTVTFGTSSAPYLAVKALNQVALDDGNKFPNAKEKIAVSFYMDDLMTGAYNLKEAESTYNEIKTLLKGGGFELQKWNSNSKELRRIMSVGDEIQDNQECLNKSISINKNEDGKSEKKTGNSSDITKILGLSWSRSDDVFKYSVQFTERSESETKRTILSDIARLFDPLGWVAPTVVLAKIFIQKLWLSGIGWDDEVPTNLKIEWDTYRNNLTQLKDFQIPRCIGIQSDDDYIELHGFCDASKSAYAAVVYLRMIDNNGKIRISLLTAKTRVAPIKQISIPRLELCGALLLSHLLLEVAYTMKIHKDRVRAWTDSTIVLAWLNSHPNRWKNFVANRVSEILTNVEATQWAHISSDQNPADCASRGLEPKLLVNNTLWLQGPRFLRDKEIVYNRTHVDTKLEECIKSHLTVNTEESFFVKYSTLWKLVRIVAFLRRFLHYKKNKKEFKYLKRNELENALKCCIKNCQKEEFQEEYLQLKKEGCLKNKESKLKSLCPYLDEDDIMRVRGRLQQSSLPLQTKHPAILPRDAHFTNLIIADAHDRTLHGNHQLMLNYLRSAYWIVGLKVLVKKYVRNCIICVKNNIKVRQQLMGSLPTVRCTPNRPFLHSGVDYAGPINIRTSKGRGQRSYKGYICVFVCMATRAVHLEVASDLTTQAFIAAFRRFVSRRGHCAQLWSDNGSNFVGAARELKALADIQSSIAETLEASSTEWHFIPPHSPNFGGLWEAAVKSTKYHLKRILGEATLTFEEMSTLLCQIEACLNSRPITIINVNDIDEPLPLTPGHFLVGEPLISVPDTNYEYSYISPLNRWQLIQKKLQDFWKRWSQEYLTTLLNRHKWQYQLPEPKLGDVVLVKESDLPPSRWLLGRVLEKHPGIDNITRVVTLRVRGSTLKRPTSKLCVLPIDGD